MDALCREIAEEAVNIFNEGQTLYLFKKRVATIMQRHGYNGWSMDGMKIGSTSRFKRAYQNQILLKIQRAINMLFYQERRYKQLKEAKFDYWVYIADSCECSLHSEWDRLILPHNHSFWQTHYPPNGWWCSCYISASYFYEGAKRLGGKARRKLPEMWNIRNPKTGAHSGVEEGWNTMVGEKKPLDIVKEVWDEMNKEVAFYRPYMSQ